jgi:hypothetical protein
MDPSTRTEDLEGASVPAAPNVRSAHDAPTARLDAPTTQHNAPAAHPGPAAEGLAGTEGGPPASDAQTKEVRPSMLSSMHEQCSACGAPMASDQRYCLRCGERNGPARVPALDRAGQRTQAAPAAGPPQRPRTSVNTALIAGVGTLLLALGVGVLIGRSSNSSSSKTPAAQVIRVPEGGGSAGTAGTGTTGSASTPGASTQTHGAAAAKTSKSNAAATAAAAAAASKAAVKKAVKGPPPKVVTVGSPGKGPGYQKGHFTGNFFGGEEPEEK